MTDHYQSNGACHDTCLAQYAFAILQGSNCWCSNYVPSDTTSTSSCDEDCPGYPSDKCGSESAGLFGYIALSISPSGTIGAASSSSSSSSSSFTSSIAAPSTVQVVSNISSLRPLDNTIPASFPISILSSAVFVQPSSAPFSSIIIVPTTLSSTSQVLIPVQTVPASPSLLTIVHTVSAVIPNSVTVLETVVASFVQTSVISLVGRSLFVSSLLQTVQMCLGLTYIIDASIGIFKHYTSFIIVVIIFFIATTTIFFLLQNYCVATNNFL